MDHCDDSRDDAALVALVLAGERELFGPLLLRYYPSVVRLCRRLLGPTLEAQDLAQEAALQAFLGLANLRDPGRFGAWLHAIAANLARMALRRRHPLSLEWLGEGERMVVLWAAGSPAPEEVHAAREIHDAIVAALNELSVVNREVVIGFYLEGYSYDELAELLGVPVSTVKGRLFKGRRQLRRTLAPLARDVLTPDRRPRKERIMEAPELVEVTLDSIRVSLLTQHRVMVLRESGNGRYVPIWIGPFEADAIALAIEGHQPQRPMTHDLALRLLAPLGARMQRVVVNKMAEQTFFAEITLAVGDQIHHVDARPSDAIALAVRTGVPIFVARSVLDTAGLENATQDDVVSPQVEAAAFAAVQQRPFIERTWMFLMHLLTGAQGPIDFGRLGDVDLEQSFAVRATEREGQPMVEVRLPGADEAGWLLLQPALWEQFTAMFQEMREAQTKFAQLIVGRAGAAPAGEPRSSHAPEPSDEPAQADAPAPAQEAGRSQGRRRKGKSRSGEA